MKFTDIFGTSHVSRSFDGRRLVGRRKSVRRLIIVYLEATTRPATAWEVAKAINALGSTVSSAMFKMRKEGLLKEVGTPTARGGRRYQTAWEGKVWSGKQ